jgi:uncharacterized membrane protein
MDITPSNQGAAQSGQSHTHLTSAELNRMLGGIHFRFPSFKHDHPPVINVNVEMDQKLTVGQKVADKVAATVGSWPFIITQSIILAVWLVLNSLVLIYHWDPYPFILLNLMLSFQAAYAAPFVMMSQNRQSEKDRLTAQNDYQTDMKGEEEIRNIMDHLDHQDKVLLQIIARMEEQHHDMLHRISQLDPELAKRLGIDIVEMSAEEVKTEDKEIDGSA